MSLFFWCALAWGIWVLGHLALMIFVRPNVPHFNGLRVHIPDWVKMKLTHAETKAIWFHEKGHQLHRHPWKNLLRVALFRPFTNKDRLEQECEADDHAHRMGYGIELARALRKLSTSAFDNVRARRLEMIELNRRYNPDFDLRQPHTDGQSESREE